MTAETAKSARKVRTGRREVLVRRARWRSCRSLCGMSLRSGGHGKSPPLFVHIARDDRRLEAIAEGSPSSRQSCASSRSRPGTRCLMTASAPTAKLSASASPRSRVSRRLHRKEPTLVLATVNAACPARAAAQIHPRLAKNHRARPADRHGRVDPALESCGVHAQRHGDGARRVCRPRRHHRPVSAGPPQPVRLDFFGDTLEQIKAFDPETQRTGKIVQRIA